MTKTGDITGEYNRILFRGVPIYLNPEGADWFIPTERADAFLQMARQVGTIERGIEHFIARNNGNAVETIRQIWGFLGRVSANHDDPYRGRSAYRSVTELKECWFHITNRCNMNCTHCMFSSNGRRQPSLPNDLLMQTIDEAFSLGCRIFYFTGGEPFVYKNFPQVLDRVLSLGGTHAVVLTNGKGIKNFDEWLRKASSERIHLQLSIDGMEINHDRFRGRGAYAELMHSIAYLNDLAYRVTLAMSVNRANIDDMTEILSVAERYKIKNIHYLWYFTKGRGTDDLFVPADEIFLQLIRAYEQAEKVGITIDNVEILKSQVFSFAGTRFDLSNAGWESITVGPTGDVFPSPALVGETDLAAGNLLDGLERVWKESPVMERLRNASIIDAENTRDDMGLLLGGGDIDHSYIHARQLVGGDPYLSLYRTTALYLLALEAQRYKENGRIGMIARMGERVYECDEDSAHVAFTHSNCVLSLPGKDGYASIRSFYSSAATDVNEDIINPVTYDEMAMSHIPEHSRVRSYGCGSPVFDCDLAEGETLVDLGCGAGVECFIAAKRAGPTGHVYGIDMEDAMLDIARASRKEVASNLGFDTVEFRKGFLEDVSVASGTVDVVISNCVINLSPDKRRTFAEIRRILRPGGRLCISDIVTEEDIPIDIKYNEKLRGECIGGAMRQNELVGMLEDLGFQDIFIIKRFLYRQVRGYDFHSITYRAFKPHEKTAELALYRGPFAAVMTDDGQLIRRGESMPIILPRHVQDDGSFFVLDRHGNVTNIEQDITCACFIAPDNAVTTSPAAEKDARYQSGCMVCGTDIIYLSERIQKHCHYCGRLLSTNTICQEGHFVCDVCHSQDSLTVIRDICIATTCDDAVELFSLIRSHPAVPVHGPEYHSLVPAVLLSVYRNMGGDVTDDDIRSGIDRGKTVCGGACAFLGICGAATGVGVAFSLIMRTNPYKARERQLVQTVAGDVLARIAAYEAPRCCQRDCWIGITAAAELSARYLPHRIPADVPLVCTQFQLNKECIGAACPLWPRKEKTRE